jgi:murein DD-endopeptidase MepM/ murein hydrolase activator NlpD
VIRQLIAAYSYDVDFQRDIKSGDSFSVYYEASVDPETGQEHISNLLYANLKINGKNRPVYAYESESGVSFYYADGQSVKKQFMSTPINGARISSGYGLRMHPIHGYTKFHKGLDFAAPRGTPVIAAADGVVTKSCWYGTYGHYIEIQHSGGYSTAYAHLSGYAKHIRPGVRVSQGRTIGYVGSTGASTGPHLHFELKKNGSQINPRTKSLHNSTNRLSGNDLKKFQKIRQDVDGKVNASLNKIKL